MDALGADDGTDFRPFFDMVIGILFVLLILVAAQVYFQQTQNETTVSEAAKHEAALRRADIAAFLGALAGRLRAGGLDAIVDFEAEAVVLPLREVLSVDRAGLPSVQIEAMDQLDAALSPLAACVMTPRSTAPICLNYARLGLERLTVTTRVGRLPPEAALAPDRFGYLANALLSARMLGNAPGLIGASGAASGRVIDFTSALSAPTATSALSAPTAAEQDVRGDLLLDFAFQL